MSKRKKEYDQEYLLRKIRRYTKKLNRGQTNDDDDLPVSHYLTENASPTDDEKYSYSAPDSPGLSVHQDQDPIIQSVVEIPPLQTDPVGNVAPQTTEQNFDQGNCEIPIEILEMLGEARKAETALGKNIPKEISERWGSIIIEGLSKEQRDSLVEKNLIPENFTLARAPKLNPEVSAILSDSTRNRDKRLEKAQNQLGIGIAGLATLTSDLINKETNKFEIIKKLSEISQVLLDLHHDNTLNRRHLIIPLLDKKFMTFIKNVKRDTYLFGENLGESIKTSKNIERSSLQIKNRAYAPAPSTSKVYPGNGQAPPRQQFVRQTGATARRQAPPLPPAAAPAPNRAERGGPATRRQPYRAPAPAHHPQSSSYKRTTTRR